MPSGMYLPGVAALLSGGIDFDSDTLKVSLLTSSYTPDLDAHDFFDDVSAYEVSGTGYTTGGASLANASVTATAANSWAAAWSTATSYTLNYLVRPTTGNGYLYRAVAAGTSGGSEPTWPTTVGTTVVDSGVTWLNVGRAVVVLDADDVAWASSTITARYAAIYKSTGTAGTSRLIYLADFAGDIVSTAGTFTVQWSEQGINHQAIA